MNKNELPWTEKYRPSNISDISSHEYNKKILDNFIKNGSLPNLLFYGPPGTGKTSTILVYTRKLYKKHFPYMVLELNASDERGVDVVRDNIKKFVSSKNFFCNGPKLVILDEIDAMTYDAQRVLKQVIEKYSSNARFCLICNCITKIIKSLQSRCIKFRFPPLLYAHLFSKLDFIISNEMCNGYNSCNGSKKGINAIIELSNGDLRKAINIMQRTFMTYNEINEENVYNASNNYNKKDIYIIFNWLSDKSLDYHTCYKKLQKLKNKKNLLFKNLITSITNLLIEDVDIDINIKMDIFDNLVTLEYNESSTTNDKIQTAALIGLFR